MNIVTNNALRPGRPVALMHGAIMAPISRKERISNPAAPRKLSVAIEDRRGSRALVQFLSAPALAAKATNPPLSTRARRCSRDQVS
jgi:hypothetical protein